VPIQPVSGASPVYDRPHQTADQPIPLVAHDTDTRFTAPEALLRLMGSPDIASKRWIWEQYDSMVMADTVAGSGGDAAIVRIHGTNKALALTSDCTPRYCEADPMQGGMQAVAEAWRNLTAVGARPLAVTNCLNFGNPERPAIMGQFVGCIEGMAKACRELDFPVVSGNVSLYNETDGRAIQPTPTIGGVGLIEDLGRMGGMAWSEPDLTLVLIGESYGWVGASLYLREIIGQEEGAPPPVDLAAERRNGDCVRQLIRDRLIDACHDLSDGGLLVALTEMCLAAKSGARLELPKGLHSVMAWCFGEEQARYIIALKPEHCEAVMERARDDGVIARVIGTTGGDALTIGDHDPIPLGQLADANEGWMPRFMA
ncbi:MAG: AIR synthase related protein, partial [Pseudomonadota bacterium]